jgi:LPS sulfotransferase NodH
MPLMRNLFDVYCQIDGSATPPAPRANLGQPPVSYDRAIRSGVWWSIPIEANGKGEAPTPASVIAPPFDFEQIDEWVTRLTEFEVNRRRHVKRTGIEAFEVAYEDLVGNFESTVLAVLRYLDLPDPGGM